MSNLHKNFIIMNDTTLFERGDIVKYLICSDSEDLYLMQHLEENWKAEWIMNYNLYPVNPTDRNNRIEKQPYFEEIANQFLRGGQ